MADPDAQIQRLQKSLEELTVQNERLQRQRDEAQAELSVQITAKDDELEKLRRELRMEKDLTESINKDYKFLESQTTTVNKEKAAAEEKIKEKEHEIAKLKIEATSRETYISDLEERLAVATSEEVTTAKDTLEHNLTRAKADLDAETRKLNNLRDTYSEYQKSCEAVRNDLTAATNTIAQLQAEIERHNENTHRLNQQNEANQAIHRENRALQEQLARFTREVEDDFDREPNAYVAPPGTAEDQTLDHEIDSNTQASGSADTSTHPSNAGSPRDSIRGGSPRGPRSPGDPSDHSDSDDEDGSEHGSTVQGDGDEPGPKLEPVPEPETIIETVYVETPVFYAWNVNEHNAIACWFMTELVTLQCIQHFIFSYLPHLMGFRAQLEVDAVDADDELPVPPGGLPNEPPTPLAPPNNDGEWIPPKYFLLLLNLSLHSLLYYLIYSTWKERSMWLAANNLSRSVVWGFTQLAHRKGLNYGFWNGFFSEGVSANLDKVALTIIEGLGGSARKGWRFAG